MLKAKDRKIFKEAGEKNDITINGTIDSIPMEWNR